MNCRRQTFLAILFSLRISLVHSCKVYNRYEIRDLWIGSHIGSTSWLSANDALYSRLSTTNSTVDYTADGVGTRQQSTCTRCTCHTCRHIQLARAYSVVSFICFHRDVPRGVTLYTLLEVFACKCSAHW